MIDWVHDMCRVWARQARHSQSGYASQSPQAATKDHQGGGTSSFCVRQFMQESFTGDGLAVHLAVRGDMAMGHGGAPAELQAIIEAHYMDRRKAKQKAPELQVSVTEYWRLVDRLHYWIAARVPREANCANTVPTKSHVTVPTA